MSSSTFNLKKNILLRAGAGAGKTTALTELFFRFTDEFRNEYGRMPRIVITTFTRKATQEIKERLLKIALEKNSSELFQFVGSKSSVHISTIHGILSHFLREQSSELGMSPDFQVITNIESKKVSMGIIRSVFKENNRFSVLLETMDFNQIQVALEDSFDNWIRFPDSTYITAENQIELAHKELQCIGKKLILICEELLLQTQEKKYVNYYQPIMNWDWSLENDQLSDFISKARLFFDENIKPRMTKNVYDPLLDQKFNESKKELLSFINSESLSLEFLKEHDEVCSIFIELIQLYSKRILEHKLSTGMITMSDLERLSLFLMRQCPSSAESFSKNWDYWMVDEYQDTSPLQVELLKSLIGQSKSFVVGDPQQSIYLFRGARSEVFHWKHEEIHKNNDFYEFKKDNWRSTPEVLGFLNYFFSIFNSTEFSSMTTQKKPVNPGQVVAEIISINENASSEQGDERIDDLDQSESLVVTERIQNLLQKGVLPETICVLARTNRMIDQIATGLTNHSVPICVHNSGSFFSRREVTDAMALAKFILNPHDNLNLITLLRSPWFYISDSDISLFCQTNSNSIWKSIAEYSHPSLVHLNEILQMAHHKGFGSTFKSALIQFGFFDSASFVDPSGRREANLWKLVSIVMEEESRPGFNFLKIIERGLDELSPDEGSSDGDAVAVVEPKKVNLMTIHASKGLQFNHVFIVGMSNRASVSRSKTFLSNEETGCWTLQLRDESSQSMKTSFFGKSIVSSIRSREEKESHRILYVGMTRAKESITLVYRQKLAKGSWAEKFSLLGGPGDYQVEFDGIPFSYSVNSQFRSPQKWIMDQESSKNEIPKLTFPLSKGNGWGFSTDLMVSVTELIKSSYELDKDIIRPNKYDGDAIYRSIKNIGQGIFAHSLFEKLKYFSIESIRKEVSSDDRLMIDYLFSLSEVPIEEILKFGFVEWGFTIKKHNQYLQGQIDLWGQLGKELWIVDYKIGSSRYKEKAFSQLNLYAEALQQMGFNEDHCDINLVVIFPKETTYEIRKIPSLLI